MSFFSWFGRKSPAPESEPQHSSDLGQTDATVPMHAPQEHPAPGPKKISGSGSRNDRLERRELLYAVVRECMTGAGVLSSSYKFKVLSLDSSGRKYLIMVDIPQVYLSDPARFAEIEAAIARSAKERFDILVTALYWRINELVTAGMHRPSAPRKVEVSPNLPEALPTAAKTSATKVSEDHAALLQEEVLAFKRAVASAAKDAMQARPGEMLRSKRRNPEPMPDFSDTEPFEASSPLGPSQFGGLK